MTDNDRLKLLIDVGINILNSVYDRPYTRYSFMLRINEYRENLPDGHRLKDPKAELNKKMWYEWLGPSNKPPSKLRFELCLELITDPKEGEFLLSKEDFYTTNKSKLIQLLQLESRGWPYECDLNFNNFIGGLSVSGEEKESYLAYHEIRGLYYKLIFSNMSTRCSCDATLLVYQKRSFEKVSQDLDVPFLIYEGGANLAPPGNLEIELTRSDSMETMRMFSMEYEQLESETSQLNSFRLILQETVKNPTNEFRGQDKLLGILDNYQTFEKRSIFLRKLKGE